MWVGSGASPSILWVVVEAGLCEVAAEKSFRAFLRVARFVSRRRGKGVRCLDLRWAVWVGLTVGGELCMNREG